MSYMHDSNSFDPYAEHSLDELPEIIDAVRREPVSAPTAAELKRTIDSIGEGPATVANTEITGSVITSSGVTAPGVTTTTETVWVSNAALREQFLRGDHR